MDVNIPKSIIDIFYRYRRELISIRKTGRNQNTKTYINNFKKIAHSISRPQEVIAQYFKKSLNTSIFLDNKRGEFMIKGSWSVYQLEIILEEYIIKFVLCSRCKNPETKMLVRKQLQSGCTACGHRTIIYDMLFDWIIKWKKRTK